ncbi:DUF6174 domain-containing protein [Streptomyces millisiae]|uniref:DUF6174 domain-containing protein n=1 Tax=Streptomyces millisiae TaxID=3075542 RepID=A0ABU2M198_9ACTN|nr:DUF6174 domain-containing protein [Streptomyces sp. DSM 44918]MDT0323569.1 DUF6174 domain-containing protein [Streptomyces sp. DSM 44918]
MRAAWIGGVGLVAALGVLLVVVDPEQSDGPDVSAWEDPTAYRFVVEGSCGETSLSGRWGIAVEDGEVAELTDLTGLFDPPEQSPEMGMTIAELLALAEEAEEEGADVVEVDYAEEDPARPETITVDYDTNAIDDEMCYRISDYAPGS